jgi:hypothetical protein
MSRPTDADDGWRDENWTDDWRDEEDWDEEWDEEDWDEEWDEEDWDEEDWDEEDWDEEWDEEDWPDDWNDGDWPRSGEGQAPGPEVRHEFLWRLLAAADGFQAVLEPERLSRLHTAGLSPRDLRAVVARAAADADDGTPGPTLVRFDDVRAALRAYRAGDA